MVVPVKHAVLANSGHFRTGISLPVSPEQRDRPSISKSSSSSVEEHEWQLKSSKISQKSQKSNSLPCGNFQSDLLFCKCIFGFRFYKPQFNWYSIIVHCRKLQFDLLVWIATIFGTVWGTLLWPSKDRNWHLVFVKKFSKTQQQKSQPHARNRSGWGFPVAVQPQNRCPSILSDRWLLVK